MLRLAICGPSRCGKDSAALYLRDRYGMVYWGSTSRVILPHVAQRLGISEETAYANRHAHADLWFAVGNELRRDDRAALARHVLARGDLCVGVRDHDEMEAVRDEGLCDLSIWLDRPGRRDPTMRYGPELCDVTILNHGSLDHLYARLDRLARAIGL